MEIDPVRHGGAGFRTFLNIAKEWSLDEGEQMKLLDIHDQDIFHEWKASVLAHDAVAIPMSMIMRIGCVLSIYSSLVTLFSHDRGARWLRAMNGHPTFNGRSALEIMTSGELKDLDFVVGYLLAKIYT